ncbi:hypothetical protein F5X99DRAFT_31671 [Biscogniauxia marginata]|nr:hypothetical protein F5X99DRAFT_31671 [Biscogniauxia marginata]
MKSGKLVEGADPAIPRRYRAFENRRTPSLSTTEYRARALKNWINYEKDLRGRSRSRSPSTVGPSDTSSSSSGQGSGSSDSDYGLETLLQVKSSSSSDYGLDELFGGSSTSSSSTSNGGYGLDTLFRGSSVSSSSSSSSNGYGLDAFFGTSSDSSDSWSVVDADSGEDGEDTDETFDPEEFNAQTLEVAQAMMAQAASMPGSGNWMSKVTSIQPGVGSGLNKLPPLPKGFQFQLAAHNQYMPLPAPPGWDPCDNKKGPSSNLPNKPPCSDESLYNSQKWGHAANYNDLAYVQLVSGSVQPKPGIETGWLTWKQAEKDFPTFDRALHLHKLPRGVEEDKGVWDPNMKVIRERKLPANKRKPLMLGAITTLSLEIRDESSQAGEYSLAPQALPDKVPDQAMKFPGPSAAKLPLLGPSGSSNTGGISEKITSKAPSLPQKETPEPPGSNTAVTSQIKFPATSPTTTTFNQKGVPTGGSAGVTNPNSPDFIWSGFTGTTPTPKKPPTLHPNNTFFAPPGPTSPGPMPPGPVPLNPFASGLPGLAGNPSLGGGLPPIPASAKASKAVAGDYDGLSPSSEPSSTESGSIMDSDSIQESMSSSVISPEDVASDSTSMGEEDQDDVPLYETFSASNRKADIVDNNGKRPAQSSLSSSLGNKKQKTTTVTSGTFYSSSSNASDSEKENYATIATATTTTTTTTASHRPAPAPFTSATLTPKPRPRPRPRNLTLPPRGGQQGASGQAYQINIEVASDKTDDQEEEEEEEEEDLLLTTSHPRLIQEYRAARAERDRLRRQEGQRHTGTPSDAYQQAQRRLAEVTSEMKRVIKEDTTRKHAEAEAEAVAAAAATSADLENSTASRQYQQRQELQQQQNNRNHPHHQHLRTKSVRFALETGPNDTMRDEARRALNRYEITSSRRRGGSVGPFR